MAEGRHQLEDKRPPPEGPSGPPGGLTRRKLTDFAVELSLALLLKVIDWLLTCRW
jgi:hypothetical protein